MMQTMAGTPQIKSFTALFTAAMISNMIFQLSFLKFDAFFTFLSGKVEKRRIIFFIIHTYARCSK